MKIFLLLIPAFAFTVTAGYTQEARRCGTAEYQLMQEQQDPSIKVRRALIEEQTRAFIENQKISPAASVVITIPVVVHVVWKTAAENIPDIYIQQQIDVLNKEFRKLNTDLSTVPAAFQPLIADCEIEFCLASKTPAGAATTGIIHKQTTVTSFGITGDPVKFNSSGGSDAWNTNKYLNLWICNISGYFGYSNFPGTGNANIDGVVLLYSTLPGPPVKTNYDMGRTATHEIGHWFNLRHPWGPTDWDTNPSCDDDLVSDTPPQQYSTLGCPTFPQISCNNGPNGGMFMNFMEYVDDNCMVMFSAGQKQRMQAALNGPRSSLLTSAATNCSIGTGVADQSFTDLISIYPNPSTGDIFMNAHTIASFEVVIYNAIGEAIRSKKINTLTNREAKLDLNDKPNGIYLVKIKTSEGTTTKKIVLNR